MSFKIPKKLSLAAIAFAISCFSAEVNATTYDSDSRIKTFVFTDNEVYSVVARNNFQTNIEFGKDENIETLSIGDPIGWQITPAGSRVFVKPLQKRGVSNLVVITNRHSYEFELVAQDSSSASSNHAYLVRFYYPEETSEARIIKPEDRTRGDLRPVSNTPIPEIPTFSPQPQAPEIPTMLPGDAPAPAPAPVVSVAPLVAPTKSHAPVPVIPVIPEPPVNIAAPAPTAPTGQLNYNYTLTGPEASAPIKIYDNGQSTFFEYSGALPSHVKVAELGNNGKENPIHSKTEGNAIVVDKVSPEFTIRTGSSLITVFNESLKAQGF